MKQESTIMRLNRNSRHNELQRVKVLQSDQKQSARKVLATVFWDAHGIIFIEYLEKGRTITGEYYASLDRMNDEIKKKTASFSEEKKFSFIKTMHQLTNRSGPV
ncbi:PREDICTED: uncharacterized protein LOC106744915 [Dinoponera quadriceps]|uniref:Uncharacterized protein LOC106744915 n=1 Tax=Dinoponera quadriceps TaxID=609295 RepID=A0A6P3XCC1_DINQU|nr:PREDICTED: uncharacterized protein LOC106744915 [Dinoponera quadriceps]